MSDICPFDTIRPTQVTFEAEDGKPMAILQVNVEPTPHVVDQTFRLYHPELCFLKKAIRLPPWQQPAGAAQPLPSSHHSCSHPLAGGADALVDDDDDDEKCIRCPFIFKALLLKYQQKQSHNIAQFVSRSLGGNNGRDV